MSGKTHTNVRWLLKILSGTRRRMFYASILGILALVTIIVACAPAAPAPTPTSTVQAASSVSLDTPFDLKPGQRAFVSGIGIVGFTQVFEDSRCPQDVTCVWAGQAVLGVELGETDPQEIRITSQPNAGPDASAEYGDYVIAVVGLQPYPHSERSIAPDDYVVTLVVTEKTASETPEPPGDFIIREIPISSIEVLILESVPYQIHLHVTGNFQDGCSALHDVTHKREGNTVTVSITSERPKDAFCTLNTPSYDDVISLEGGFLPGDYTVLVNGMHENFTL